MSSDRDRGGRSESGAPQPSEPGTTAGEGPVEPDRGAPAEPPPFLGSWRRLYAIVLVNLVVLILLFYVFTRAFE